jgi:hypothetical protein
VAAGAAKGRETAMNRLAKVIAVGLMSVSVLAASMEWKSGIQTSFSENQWPSLLESLQAARCDRAPYRLTKRTRAFDYRVHLVTPFCAAAAKVQSRRDASAPLTFDTVRAELDSARLGVNLQTMHRSVDGAQAVTLALRADGKMVQPLMDRLEKSQLRSIGFYAEPFYVVDRSFDFDLAEVSRAKKLSVVIFESDSKQVEVPVDVSELR